MISKKCNDCKEIKSVSEFHKNGTYVRCDCKVCHYKKCRKSLLKVPITNRREYMREYLKNYKPINGNGKNSKNSKDSF